MPSLEPVCLLGATLSEEARLNYTASAGKA